LDRTSPWGRWTDLGAPIVTEEQFGPVLPIILYRDEDEAITFANDSRFGLCSSVWSEHLESAMAIACRINPGYTYINHHGPLAQDNRASFGGASFRRRTQSRCSDVQGSHPASGPRRPRAPHGRTGR
jgi:acyl-CoA reductase-like NAD-dependent aldehyde dehydrogenase